MPFQRRDTGSGLRWQLTTHTVRPIHPPIALACRTFTGEPSTR